MLLLGNLYYKTASMFSKSLEKSFFEEYFYIDLRLPEILERLIGVSQKFLLFLKKLINKKT